MTRYYISGPMTGIAEYNHPVFFAVERDLVNYLKSIGGADWAVANPARNLNGETGHDRHVYLALDIQQVLDSDVVVLLPGWEKSPGALLEVDVAYNTGKRFMLATLNTTTQTYVFADIDITPEETTGANLAEFSVRGGMLDEAKQLVTNDRNNQYGPPDQDFARTAAMATGFGFSVNGQPLMGHHVAIFMNLLKMSRLAWTPTKRDSWVDAAGYSACGLETALLEEARAV